MKRILALACIVTAVAASPAMAITDDECAAAWARADVNKDGVVTVAEDSQYFVALRLAGKPIAQPVRWPTAQCVSCRPKSRLGFAKGPRLPGSPQCHARRAGVSAARSGQRPWHLSAAPV